LRKYENERISESINLNAEANFLKSLALNNLGDNHGAEESLKLAISLDQGSSEYYI